jgi:hypothetical protein
MRQMNIAMALAVAAVVAVTGWCFLARGNRRRLARYISCGVPHSDEGDDPG